MRRIATALLMPKSFTHESSPRLPLIRPPGTFSPPRGEKDASASLSLRHKHGQTAPLSLRSGERVPKAGEGRTELEHLTRRIGTTSLGAEGPDTRVTTALPLIRPRIQYGAGSPGTFSPPSGEKESMRVSDRSN